MTDLYHPALSSKPAWDGRRDFFRAIESRAPEVLASLARDVYPVFKGVVDATAPREVETPASLTKDRPEAPKTVVMSALSQWRWYRGHVMYHPGCPDLEQAPFHAPLVAWQEGYNLAVRWNSMVACKTLAGWYRAGGPPEVLAFDVSKTLRNPPDEPFVQADAEGNLNIKMRRAADFYGEGALKPNQLPEFKLRRILDEEEALKIPVALTGGRPSWAKTERERLRKLEFHRRGCLPVPERKARSLLTTPAEWLVLRQVLEWPWNCVWEASDHQDVQTLRREVRKFGRLIALPPA